MPDDDKPAGNPTGNPEEKHIRNPMEWTGAQVVSAAHAVGEFEQAVHHMQDKTNSPAPAVRRIGTEDVWQALRQGFADFQAYRSDVIFLSVIYALVGLLVARITFGGALLPLLFPMASGFAIVGPLAAVGLYEMSRMREKGVEVDWRNAFAVFRAPARAGIFALGVLLIVIFLAWLAAAWGIFALTIGPELPGSTNAFLHDVFLTGNGQIMIVVGLGVGFLFALLAMTVSVVSFPMLLDRDVGLDTAIKTSFRAVATNPGPMALWGLMVAVILLVGMAVLFVGLIAAIPVLGHATWHLYRKLVA